MMDPEQLEELASSSEAAEGILSAMSECGSPGAEKHPGLSSSSSEEDVYTALANRERDLMLAAELGKALLEKNEELQRKHDQAVEEYTAKIEVGVVLWSETEIHRQEYLVYSTKIRRNILLVGYTDKIDNP